MIGLFFPECDRLLDSHPARRLGCCFAFPIYPYSIILLRSSAFHCLALSLRSIMVTFGGAGGGAREYGYVACIYLYVMHAFVLCQLGANPHVGGPSRNETRNVSDELRGKHTPPPVSSQEKDGPCISRILHIDFGCKISSISLGRSSINIFA